MTTHALLMIAHGTREPAAADEAGVLCQLLRERLHVPVAMGWVEWDLIEPAPVDAARQLEGEGATSLVTLPLLAFAAGHSKTDVPEELEKIRRALPEVPVHHGVVLGHHPRLFDLARRRLTAARTAAGLGTTPDRAEALLVTGPGSSDPDANGDLAKAARFLADTTGFRWTEIAFAGVTWPRPDEALRRLHGAGFSRVTRFSWSLLAGVLEQKVDRAVDAVVGELEGFEVVDAGRLGPTEELADAVADRYREALHGDPRSNCDLCQFRLPLPGRENRAGLPSAGGTGERVRSDAAARQAARADDPAYTDWKKA